MFSFNFNGDKPDLRSTIPAGVKLLVRFNYVPGGADIPGTPADQKTGALTKSKSVGDDGKPSDGLYLKAEFTVTRGPYKGRKFWENMTVFGGKLDEKGTSIAGDITRKNIRSMIDGARGIATSDESPEAQAKRVLKSFTDLQNMAFVVVSKIEPAKDGYPEKNRLGRILTIDQKDFPQSEAELDQTGPAGATKPAASVAVPGFAQAKASEQVPTPSFATPSTAGEAATVTTEAAGEPVVTTAVAEEATPAADGGALPGWMKRG